MDLTYLWPRLTCKRSKRGQTQTINFFICGPILKNFYALDSLWKSLPVFYIQILFISLLFSRCKGSKGPKTQFSKVHRIFISYPIWMIFFRKCSSNQELSLVCQQIWTISYRFRVIRGQKGRKYQFWKCIKFLFLIRFEWFFFRQCTLNWEISVICQHISAIIYRIWAIGVEMTKMHLICNCFS